VSIKIGKHFEVFRSPGPIDADERTKERIPILLGSGRAFGSGEHETTSSCLEELEHIPILPGSKVLDVGCGTGILSAAAARLGARYVMAVDPDPGAIKVTEQTLRLNRLEKKIIPLQGELEIVEDDDFDVIMSNLYGDLLLGLVKGLSMRLKPGGYLLLSGILYEYAYDLKTAFIQAGFDLLRARYLDEYTTLLFRKKQRMNKKQAKNFGVEKAFTSR
jgi:ribosomal protein L11 methyltransferase